MDPHWPASQKQHEKLHDLVQLWQLKEGIKFGGSCLVEVDLYAIIPPPPPQSFASGNINQHSW